MPPTLLDLARRAIRRSPLGVALSLAAIAFSAWFILWPLFSARYPPMTDLPFHAAQTAVFRHYRDPAYHFREQFELHPIAVPYVSMYAIGAVFMRFMSALDAVKLAAAVMLGLLPAGLAVLFHGMKKTPLLGVLGLGVVWCTLTHWGFLNFVGALGLFAMAVGFALLIVQRPTPGRRFGLAVTMVALFFTHIFRFPFGVAGVLGAAIVLAPLTRRVRPVLLPLAPSFALFVLWWEIRPATLEGGLGDLKPHLERLAEIPKQLAGGFQGEVEEHLFGSLVTTAAVVFMIALVLGALGRFPRYAARDWAFASGAVFVVVSCAAFSFLLFLVLPMQIGGWWYVYPREATATAFMALALFPNLPKAPILRAPLLIALAVPLFGIASFVRDGYVEFDKSTLDFERIEREIPPAPKLLYLIFDHSGSSRDNTPFIHLPAYVQADKGGWLSFHFAVWGASPIAYRPATERGSVVPPPVPLRWEWTPNRFEVKKHAPFFDWFLVRDRRAPDKYFKDDPSIVPVARAGKWWLYKREKGTRSTGRGGTRTVEPNR